MSTNFLVETINNDLPQIDNTIDTDVKSELIANLEIARDTFRDLDKIFREL